jgi:regulator of CtrA degradation
VRLDTSSAKDNAVSWFELPGPFRDLVTRSLSLQGVVRRMDEQIYGGPSDMAALSKGRPANPVSDQILLLKTAFARG